MNRFIYWWVNHLPFITTKKRQDQLIIGCLMKLEEVNSRSVWAAINPIIHDLESLRADTWNQDKITKMQNFLRENFYVEIQKQKN